MRFHRARRHGQRAADFLVGQARDDEAQHLAFAFRQLRIAFACLPVGLVAFARAHMLAHRVLQRLDQGFVVHRLFQELGGTRLERAPAHLHRAVAGEHDDRLVHALGHQGVQHCQAADARHAHVEHDGPDALPVELRQKGLRVAPGLHP